MSRQGLLPRPGAGKPARVRASPCGSGYATFSRLTNRCALEGGVGFRQLRMCRRTRPGQLCFMNGHI